MIQAADPKACVTTKKECLSPCRFNLEYEKRLKENEKLIES